MSYKKVDKDLFESKQNVFLSEHIAMNCGATHKVNLVEDCYENGEILNTSLSYIRRNKTGGWCVLSFTKSGKAVFTGVNINLFEMSLGITKLYRKTHVIDVFYEFKKLYKTTEVYSVLYSSFDDRKVFGSLLKNTGKIGILDIWHIYLHTLFNTAK